MVIDFIGFFITSFLLLFLSLCVNLGYYSYFVKIWNGFLTADGHGLTWMAFVLFFLHNIIQGRGGEI